MIEDIKPFMIVIPTQLPVGTVNAYLLQGDENVLVDTGPQHPKSRRWVERGLGKAGLRVADIDVLLITHGHVDHYGQAGSLSADSGAEVWVPELEKRTIQDFSQTYEDRKEFYRERLLSTGIPEVTLRLVDEFFDYVKGLARACPVHRTFRDGDRLSVGGHDLEVMHTPGHSPGSSCFKSGGTLLSGDTVLSRITPNAAFGGADGKSVGMADYLQSLERLSRLEVKAVYPGHGTIMEGIGPFIENYRELYRTRREAIIELLREKSRTPFDLVVPLFGSLPIHEVFLGLTEVLGHLEILERDGVVIVEEQGGLDYYSVALKATEQ